MAIEKMTSDVSGGPGWWQAADLKWYPPQRHPDYVAPPRPPPRQQPSWQQPVPQAAGPPTGPPPGWYADPSGKPGQMYWDGQRWHTGIPTTSPPAAAPTPWDKVRPHVDKARPQLDKGRRFWSGLSRERKVILALAGLLVVVAVIAVPVAGFDYLFGGPDTGPGSAQAACNAINAHPGTNTVHNWAQGRVAAGDSKENVTQTLFDAEKVCPEFAQMIQLASKGY